MGYWGWRLLAVVFISVWVVGCTITHDTAPTLSPTQPSESTLIARISPSHIAPTLPAPSFQATLYPTATPFLYQVQQGETFSQIARQFGVSITELQAANTGIEPRTLQIGDTLYIPDPHFDTAGYPIYPTPTPINVPIAPPFCHPTSTDQILCLGVVTNQLNNPIEQVAIAVRLLRADGSLLADGETIVEQGAIMPGEYAPFRLLFTAKWEDLGNALAWIQSAERGSDELLSLNVESPQRSHVDDHYLISAVVYNGTAETAWLMRAVVTLHDQKGQVIGYRVIQLNQLMASGERTPLEMTVIPQLPGDVAQHTLHIEARRVAY